MLRKSRKYSTLYYSKPVLWLAACVNDKIYKRKLFNFSFLYVVCSYLKLKRISSDTTESVLSQTKLETIYIALQCKAILSIVKYVLCTPWVSICYMHVSMRIKPFWYTISFHA